MSLANPFDGIITTELKTLYKQAIDEILSDSACSTPCRFYYIGQKYEDCTNCVGGVIGNKGYNPYYHGGMGRMPSQQPCAHCDGTGKRLVETTYDDYMCTIWDYNKWIRVGNVSVPEGRVQTICGVDLISHVRNCQYVLFNTDLEEYTRHRFTLDGEPNPCGFGEDAYIISLWKRA